MATYSYPGVYVQELPSPVHPITGVPTSIAAFVGYTASGIDNRAQEIFSSARFLFFMSTLTRERLTNYFFEV